VHEERLAPRVVLQHRVSAEIARGGTRWESGGADPTTGHGPALAESQHCPAEDVLVAVGEPEPLSGVSE
jgi:hypothetical protein